MATRKLTLSADGAVIDEAKRFAASRDTTVSAIFSRLLRAVAHVAGSKNDDLGPLTAEVSGLIKLKSKQSYRDLLGRSLSEKYAPKN